VPDEGGAEIRVLVPGTLAVTQGIPLVNPLGKQVHLPVGLIELTAAGITLSLSDLYDRSVTFAGQLESGVAKAMANFAGDRGETRLTVRPAL
jgi:hypothetical protein